jgi:transcriptional regulator GlxA family with amidase domain
MNSKLNHIQNWPELAEQAKWSVSNLAKLCGVTTETVRKHFTSHMGKTTQEWLAEHRLKEAKSLLNTKMQIKEIAISLGYNHQSNFSRSFKVSVGFCPSKHQTICADLHQDLRE